MNIDVAFTTEKIAKDVAYKSVVVTDILRASTTITTAIANGASYIIPVSIPEEAFTLAEKYKKGIILGGERDNMRIDGFHLGNSPMEYSASFVNNKPIIFCTTNGTRAINACSSAEKVIIASFLNISASCRYLSRQKDIIILCSGKKGRFCMEDSVFAGAFIDFFCRISGHNVDKSDSAIAAEILYKNYSSDILSMLQHCEHGKSLFQTGFGGDLALCARIDVTKVVPVYQNGKIISG